MNQNDFNLWLADYSACFPDTAAWLNQNQARSATLRHWFTIMAPVDLKDARTATAKMLAGDFEHVKPFEREMTPQHVRKLSERVRAIRTQPEIKDELPEYLKPRAEAHWSSAGVLAEVLKRVSAGEHVKEIVDELCTGDEPAKARRYRCLDCLDTGMVTVWHVVAMKAMAEGKFSDATRRTCVVRCNCEASNRYSWMKQAYDDRRWAICRDVHDESSVDALRDLMENFKPEGYVEAFDNF